MYGKTCVGTVPSAKQGILDQELFEIMYMNDWTRPHSAGYEPLAMTCCDPELECICNVKPILHNAEPA